MKKPILFSIVTPSFNQAEFIEQTIQSVINQKGSFFIDYIIIDGGSTDNSVSIIEKYESIVKKEPVKVRLKDLDFHDCNLNGGCLGISYRWASEKDNGQVDAINKGFKMAVGSIYAFLNSDDTYYPDTLTNIARQNWGKMDFIYGKGMWISVEGKELLAYPTFKPNKYNFVYQCTLCQPTVFIKKESFEELGAFSMDFDVVFDFEYWMRAVFDNRKFIYLNSFLATSRFYVENKTMAQKDTQLDEVQLLRSKYYKDDFSRFGKFKQFLAKYTTHRKTVKRVNSLHQMINSGITYAFK